MEIISEKVKYKFEQLHKVSARLNEALLLEFPSPETKADCCIQRFEFTTELFWRFLKVLLEFKGISVNASPVDVIREAKAAGILDADERWIALVRDRTLTSHTYDDAQAKVIYDRIRDTYANMFKVFIEHYERNYHYFRHGRRVATSYCCCIASRAGFPVR